MAESTIMRALIILALWLSLGLSGVACHRDTMSKSPFSDPVVVQLAEAVTQGNAYAIRTQIQQGADPNAQGDEGVNLLQFAIFTSNVDGLVALLDNGADPNRPGIGGSSAVHTASIVEDPVYLQRLLDHGGDPDVRHAITGETPLAQAVGPKTNAQLQLLLAAGADPNAADRTGNTPLHRAARINAGAQVLALLEAGANAQAKNAQDATFQPYYFDMAESVINDRTRAERAAVVHWLREHDVPLEAGAGQHVVEK